MKQSDPTGLIIPPGVQTADLSRRKFIQSVTSATSGAVAFGGEFFRETASASGVVTHNLALLTGERIAATPTHRYRAYRSKRAQAATATAWLQIDLGKLATLESIKLYPANQFMYPGKDKYYAGEGFPLRFRIESSRDPTLNHPNLIVDHTNEDLPSPQDGILSFPCTGAEARYVRLTINKFPQPFCARPPLNPPEAWAPCEDEKKYWFALAKIAIMSAGQDIAVGRPVFADEVYGNPPDLSQLTRPDRIETEYVHRDRPSYVTDPSTWRPVSYAARVPLLGVTLHGGLFEMTMRKNIAYLLESFSVDDLLLQFRKRANKPIPPSTRQPNQFWEDDLAGSNAARFLMGAGNTLRWIDDPELRSRLNAVVNGIAECRQSNGYIMAYPEDTIFFSERGGYTRAWLTHGLIEAGYAGSAIAFELLRGYYDWFNRCKYLPDLMRGAVQGAQGMVANTRMYFTPSGKSADVQVIQQYFLEDHWLEELASGKDAGIWQYPYDRPHCYLLTNLEAYLDLYRATGEGKFYDGVKAAWEMYHAHWEQPGGSISIIEYQYDPPDANSLTQKLGELCGSSFWVFLSQRFQLMAPWEERYAAEIEKSIYNVAIANQDGTTGLRYHTVLVGQKEEGTRHNTCCEGQGTRLIGSLPEHIFSIAPDGLYVNLFEPSTISWKHDGVDMNVRLETEFPYGNDVKLTVFVVQPKAMKLRVRVPSWATGAMKITIANADSISGSPGSFLTVDRTWSDGDVVAFTLPSGFMLTEYAGVDQVPGHKRYSLMYGPLLYAAVGPRDSVLRVRGWDSQDLLRQLSPKPDAPLQFTVAGNPTVTYKPYWQVTEEEFTCFPIIEPWHKEA